jgi:TUP1-like enhancer of split
MWVHAHAQRPTPPLLHPHLLCRAHAAGEAAAGGALQHAVTRAHLEDTLNCALALDSPLEFERALALYARHLAAPGEPARAPFKIIGERWT